MIFFRVLM